MPVKKRVTTQDSSLGKERKKAKHPKKVASSKPKRKISKITKQERESIKQAVSSLPSLIIEHRAPFVEEAAQPRPTKPEEPKKNSFAAPSAKQQPVNPPAPLSRVWDSPIEKKKRNLLWVLVGTLSIFILTLWIVNVGSQVSDANFHFGSEEMLWQTAKDDFKTFVKPTDFPELPKKEEELSPTEQEKIKQVLLENLPLITVESTSTTSSPAVSTSTLATTSTKP